jgi:hypothetical protein
MLFLFSIDVVVLAINDKHTLPVKYANKRGNPDDPGGNEMESEEMKEGPPKGQDRECEKA